MRYAVLLPLITISTIVVTGNRAFADNIPGSNSTVSAADSAAASHPPQPLQKGNLTANTKKWQAEEWVVNRTSPWLLPGEAAKQKQQHKGPVRSFVKNVAKGTAKELKSSLSSMAEDMVFVFSVQDIDPYQKGPPVDKPAIVLKFTLVDGSSCYLRRFPDGSYAMEDGFVDGTVILPSEKPSEYIVAYPNGAKGRLVRKTDGTTVVYRPDKTITTVGKTNSGGYSVRNNEIGYIGEARPDRTGVHYELGEW